LRPFGIVKEKQTFFRENVAFFVCASPKNHPTNDKHPSKKLPDGGLASPWRTAVRDASSKKKTDD